MTHYTNLKQLDRLCLHTLGSIDHHYGGIRSHQCTVGILGKVLMSRCIQNIDTIIVIIKLQNGRSNGDTTFLLNLHPVRYGIFGICLSLYRTGGIDRPSV